MNRRGKRGQILGAAETLFSKFGSRRTTVEEICREAGVSKMTFYKYFRNKVALVRTIRDNWIDEGFRRFDEIKAMEISFPEKIDLMTQWKAEFGRRVNAEFVRELVSTEDALDEYRRRYLSNIRAAQLKGEVRPDIDPEILWVVVDRLPALAEGAAEHLPGDQAQAHCQKQLGKLLLYGLVTRN